jgi:hypothetical protein
MPKKVKIPFRLDDAHCLLWVKDPSISPFENDKSTKLINIISRKNILSDKDIENPKSFLNKVKRKCFFKSALREKIVEQIKEYQEKGTQRLYTYNDTLSLSKEYIYKPFTIEECKKWVSNHLVNPRTGNPITQDNSIYIELLYATIQYELAPPSGINEKTLKIIENIKYRLEFMKQNDKDFLNHNVASFDKKLKIASASPIREAAKAAKAAKAKNTFDVSTQSSTPIKPLNSAERRQLRDMALEKKEEKKLAAEYQYNKRLQPKKKLMMTNYIPSSFREFLTDLQNSITMYGNQVIDDMLAGSSLKERRDITTAIFNYFKRKRYDDAKIETILEENDLSDIDGVVWNFINNICAQLIDPSFVMPPEMAIGCFSFINKTTDFKNSQIIKKITSNLFDYIEQYTFEEDKKVKTYFRNIVEDIIPRGIVAKREIEVRIMTNNTISTSDYQNYYYKLLFNPIKKPHKDLRLPEGMGLLIGKQLTKAINDLEDPYFVSYPEDRVITDDNPLNGFTYEECKDWVLIPIINPRTMKPIVIDTPIYNRLLCMSYQYDTNLIPRMITSRGYEIIDALTNVIVNILTNEGKPPQTREQLEKFIIDKEEQYEKVKDKLVISDKSDTSDIIGLKWKDVGIKTPTNGIDITADNEALANAITAKVYQARRGQRSSQVALAFYAIFTKEELRALNVANLQKNSFIKIKRHYYIPVIAKSNSYIKQKSIASSSTAINSNTKDIKDDYIVDKYYTIVECLRWAQQPKRDPKNPDVVIPIDGKEYNTIFEQAILYDYNIQPINITAKGIRFMKSILKTKNKFLHISEFPKCSKRKGKVEYINSVACNTIENIYAGKDGGEYGKKYREFKEKMVEKCLQPKEPYMSMAALKYSIGMEFDVSPDPAVHYSKRYYLNYFQDSALASIVIYYNNIKKQIYNKEYRDIFVNDFNKFYVNVYEIGDKFKITKKDAVDAGGVRREFFTNLYKELFCDEEHLTRPFIRPADNKLDRYYINPNFEPDINFKKVILAYNKREARKKTPNFVAKFDNESDYEDIYYIIGKLLCLVVVNEEVGLPKELSTYILAGLINQPKKLDYYDILYFYIREFHLGLTYMNMIRKDQIEGLDDSGISFNDMYVLSKGKDIKITIVNCIKFLLELSKHVITKNFIMDGEANSEKNMKKRYTSLFAGFSKEIRKFLYKKRATTEQLSLLITNEQLNKEILQELANKIKVKIEVKYISDSGTKMSDEEQKEREDELKGYISKKKKKKRDEETDKDHYEFIRKLLQFWTGYNYYIKEKDYKIFYKYGVGVNINNLPEAHTCFYSLDIFGFPSKLETAEERAKFRYDILKFPANLETPEEKEKFIYDKLKWAVEAQEMELK